MTIEQHAEAAADEIDRSMTDGPKAIIAKHMQSAIDEATESLRARNDTLVCEIDRLESEVVRANTERIRTQESSEKTDKQTNRFSVITTGPGQPYVAVSDSTKPYPEVLLIDEGLIDQRPGAVGVVGAEGDKPQRAKIGAVE